MTADTLIALYLAIGIATVGTLTGFAYARGSWEPPRDAHTAVIDCFVIFYAIILWPATLLAVCVIVARR